MKPRPFESSWRRIARAKKHLRDLERSLKAYTDRKPYRLVIEPHPDGVHEVHKLKARRARLPNSFSNIAADLVENLKASLDQATFAVALACNVSHQRLHDVYFPFSSDSMKLEKRLKRCCPQFPPEIITLVRSLKPYRGGNDYLWALSEICNMTKHRVLAPMGFNIRSVDVREIRGLGGFSLPYSWDSEKNEIVLGLAKPNTRVTCNVGLAFFIGFNGIPFAEGQPAGRFLNELTRVVEQSIKGIEIEAKRIGLVG